MLFMIVVKCFYSNIKFTSAWAGNLKDVWECNSALWNEITLSLKKCSCKLRKQCKISKILKTCNPGILSFIVPVIIIFWNICGVWGFYSGPVVKANNSACLNVFPTKLFFRKDIGFYDLRSIDTCRGGRTHSLHPGRLLFSAKKTVYRKLLNEYWNLKHNQY